MKIKANAVFFAGVFALSGVLATVMFGLGDEPNQALSYAAGVPFAIASMSLKPWSRRSLWIAVLTALVWPMSFRSAIGLASAGASNCSAVCLAGVLGAVSIALIHRIGPSMSKLASEITAIAAVGAIAALPFGTWASQSDNAPYHAQILLAAFVVWQVSVGIILYWFAYRGATQELPAASAR